MDASTISAISGLVGVIVTSIVGLIVNKINSRKDITINDRQQLSQDQLQFYDMVMNEVTVLRNRADKLEKELSNWKQRATQLELENNDLRAKMGVLEKKLGFGIR
ncbi:hypothetical protein ACSVDA_12035 [Cytobacillus sp. Hm23]